MRFPTISCLLVGAGVVSASPLRVLLISESEGAGSNLRLGHPVAIAHEYRHPDNPNGPVRTRMGCGRFKEKALAMSNAFRQALGLPLIESSPHGHHHHPTAVVHPTMVVHPTAVVTPPTIVRFFPNGTDGMTKGGEHVKVVHPHHHHHHGHHRGMRANLAHESFLTRVHFALMTLGPWEGRAVAFVLGCGLGVLLRMMWVLAVISYRTIRGESEDENEYQHVLFEQYDAEDIVVAPPTYVIDEKVPIVEEQPATVTK